VEKIKITKKVEVIPEKTIIFTREEILNIQSAMSNEIERRYRNRKGNEVKFRQDLGVYRKLISLTT